LFFEGRENPTVHKTKINLMKRLTVDQQHLTSKQLLGSTYYAIGKGERSEKEFNPWKEDFVVAEQSKAEKL